MTPSLFDLPLRLGDAALLAPILFEQLGSRPVPVTSEQRVRIASRAGALRFSALKPHYGSLERDPVHPSACYLCVDAIEGEPLLLRVAPAKTPSSGLFPRSILIGRTFIGREEAVFNVVPFGPGDGEQIEAFSARVNPAFRPKVLGARPVLRICGDQPTLAFPTALENFARGRDLQGREELVFVLGPGQDAAKFRRETLWSAIRAGWREGYGLQANPSTVEEARACIGFTRFGIESAGAIGWLRRPCDIELLTTLEQMEPGLRAFKEADCAVESVALREGSEPREDSAALAREYRAVLNLRRIHVENQ